jgi:hypothetical protein
MTNQDKYTNTAAVPSVKFCDVCKFIVPDNGPCDQCFKDANEAFGEDKQEICKHMPDDPDVTECHVCGFETPNLD